VIAAIAACAALPVVAAPASAQAAPVTTAGAINVTSTSATLVGFIDANSVVTAYAFEYGTTTSYGQTTPVQAFSGSGVTEVTATVTGLSPATTYHLQLVGATQPSTNTSGTLEYGGDQTFKTLAAGSSGTGPSQNPNGSLRLIGKTLSVSSGKATVAFWCLGSKSCRGSFSISAKGKSCVSSKSFSLGATKVKAVKVGLRKPCKTLLRKATRHRVGGKLRAALSTGQSALTSKVTLARRT
jgi:hypothetical protein